MAAAIRGSNSIEGYHVDVDDAAAAVDDEEPLSADQKTFAEIRGYRQALGYVLAMAADPHFALDASAIRSMHYMMLSHDLSKSPGRYRTGPIYVHDDATDTQVYEGPDADRSPDSWTSLSILTSTRVDALVRAAMAHLNLVMIHPFRDGNGRMARALQTLVRREAGTRRADVLQHRGVAGRNTDDYYRVLALTGRGHGIPSTTPACG